MNYEIKQLLGKYDPKLLRIRQLLSWKAINSMSDTEIVMRHIKHTMTDQLTSAISLNIIETSTKDFLQLDAQIYTFEKPELLALATECYNLGSQNAKVMQHVSPFSDL